MSYFYSSLVSLPYISLHTADNKQHFIFPPIIYLFLFYIFIPADNKQQSATKCLLNIPCTYFSTADNKQQSATKCLLKIANMAVDDLAKAGNIFENIGRGSKY